MELNKIYQGNTLEALKTFPDNFVDTIITSPPYWGLRDYGEAVNTVWGGDPECKHEFELKHVYREPSKTGVISGKTKMAQSYRNYKSGFCKKCGAWYGQLGLEPTLDLYLVHLWQIADELYRVLKPTGVIFWNHGDNYGSKIIGTGGHNWDKLQIKGKSNFRAFEARKVELDVPQKSLCLQNYRFILGLIDIDYRIMVEWRAMGKPEGELEGMLKHPRIQAILRNSIIWYKPNHMPSSVRDRFASAYEPVFLLTKSRKYWFDLDAVRIPYSESGKQRRKYPVGKFGGNPQNPMGKLSKGIKGGSEATMLPEEPHPLGKNPGDMWAIPTQPFPEAHFAAFPERLIEPMIKAGCPRWICKKCGKARERIIEPTEEYRRKLEEGKGYYENYKKAGKKSNKSTTSEYYTVGWTDCGCNAGWRPGIVLDPFMGSGTVAVVAKRLGRNWIGIELNPEYIEMAYRRLDKTVYQPELFT